MLNAHPVNNRFTAVAQRPASHAAAAVFLGTSIYVAHEGLAKWAPGNLGNALTALFVAVAVLQWTAGARKADCEDARDDERASAVMAQAWRFGIIEASLFAAGGLALSGLALNAWSIAFALAGGALFAYSSFRVKWTSCDPLKRLKLSPSDGGQRVHEALFNTPALAAPAADEAMPADWSDNPTVVKFMKRVEHTGQKFAKDAEAAKAPPVRDAAVRLRLATKRIRVRAQRGAAKQRAVA